MYVSGATGYDFTYSYDATGRFEKIFLTNSSQLFQYRYDAASNETERDNLFSGVNQLYPRDALNRMTTWDARKGNSTLSHEGYTYDAMNRIKIVDWANGNTDSFNYYLDGELQQANLGNFGHNITYNLDKAGNRTSVVDNNVPSTYSPNPINQYTTGAGSTVVNGPEHEISDYQAVHYTYINDERLSSAATGTTTYSMVYDALGRCVKRTLSSGPTTYYLYDGEKPILEYDAIGTSVGVNVYGKGIDEILERVAVGSDGQWHTYFPQQNHEGSVTLLTDPSGVVLERYRYDAFGAPTIYDGNWNVRPATIYNNRFLFTGREYAAMYRSIYTGAFRFYEYRARAYHPTLGRFMSEDPKLFDAGDYNLFRYCHNDPVDLTDPMGTDDGIWTRTIERMQAYMNSKEIFRGGAIEIGSLRYAVAQMQSFTMAYTNQSQQRMYTYSLKPQHNIGDLSGARGYQYVWNSNDNCNGQCLTTVQHLSGAPSSTTPLLRGDPVGPNTKQGTAIATGFRNINGQLIYPSKPPKDFGASERINHAVFYVAPVGRGFMQTLEAQRGIAIHLSRPQPTEGWYELTSRLPPNASSTSQLHSAGGLYGPFY
jgi:RHS repeat-associated protein